MVVITVLLVVFIFTFKSLASYIKKIRTGDPNESDITYWMFSYDFKSPNKDWVPENKNLLAKKQNKDQTAELMVIKTRQYAKRQATWARGQMKDWKTVSAEETKLPLKKLLN